MANQNKRTPLLLGVLVIAVGIAAITRGSEPDVPPSFERPVYTETSWEQLEARADAAQKLVQESLERDGGRRPVLHGEAIDGNAMEHYRLAVAMTEQHESWADSFFNLSDIQGAAQGELDGYRKFAQVVAPLMHELRLGAQSARCEFELNWEASGMDWKRGLHPESFDKYDAYRMLRVAYRVAAIELLDGNSEEALLIFLDCLQFARDMTASPLLADSRCGGESLVPGWLSIFGERDGWSLFSDEQIERWIDAAEVVDDGLDLVGHEVLVETAINVRGLPAFLERMQELYDEDYIALDPSDDGDRAELLEELFYDHSLLFDFEEEFAAAFESEPLRGPHRVRQRFLRRTDQDLSYTFNTLTDFGTASAYRLRGLGKLRLLRLGLSKHVGKSDAPSTGRLGEPLLTHTGEDAETYYIETGGKGPGQALFVELPLPR